MEIETYTPDAMKIKNDLLYSFVKMVFKKVEYKRKDLNRQFNLLLFSDLRSQLFKEKFINNIKIRIVAPIKRVK